jgi:hypothetical protein
MVVTEKVEYASYRYQSCKDKPPKLILKKKMSHNYDYYQALPCDYIYHFHIDQTL